MGQKFSPGPSGAGGGPRARGTDGWRHVGEGHSKAPAITQCKKWGGEVQQCKFHVNSFPSPDLPEHISAGLEGQRESFTASGKNFLTQHDSLFKALLFLNSNPILSLMKNAWENSVLHTFQKQIQTQKKKNGILKQKKVGCKLAQWKELQKHIILHAYLHLVSQMSHHETIKKTMLLFSAGKKILLCKL